MEVLEATVDVRATLPDRVTALEAQVNTLRTEMRGGFADVRNETRELNEAARGEMRQLNEETNRHMRILHEEVIDRIKTLGEGLGQTPARLNRRPAIIGR